MGVTVVWPCRLHCESSRGLVCRHAWGFWLPLHAWHIGTRWVKRRSKSRSISGGKSRSQVVVTSFQSRSKVVAES